MYVKKVTFTEATGDSRSVENVAHLYYHNQDSAYEAFRDEWTGQRKLQEYLRSGWKVYLRHVSYAAVDPADIRIVQRHRCWETARDEPDEHNDGRYHGPEPIGPGQTAIGLYRKLATGEYAFVPNSDCQVATDTYVLYDTVRYEPASGPYSLF